MIASSSEDHARGTFGGPGKSVRVARGADDGKLVYLNVLMVFKEVLTPGHQSISYFQSPNRSLAYDDDVGYFIGNFTSTYAYKFSCQWTTSSLLDMRI